MSLSEFERILDHYQIQCRVGKQSIEFFYHNVKLNVHLDATYLDGTVLVPELANVARILEKEVQRLRSQVNVNVSNLTR